MPAAKKTIAAAWKLANFVAGCPAPAPTGERESVVTASAAGAMVASAGRRNSRNTPCGGALEGRHRVAQSPQ
jgi:hypothetical protein